MGDKVAIMVFQKIGQVEYDSLTEQGLLDMVRKMVVKQRNCIVNRLKLHHMLQGPEQPVQQYIASLKSVARTCKFLTKCPT